MDLDIGSLPFQRLESDRHSRWAFILITYRANTVTSPGLRDIHSLRPFLNYGTMKHRGHRVDGFVAVVSSIFGTGKGPSVDPPNGEEDSRL